MDQLVPSKDTSRIVTPVEPEGKVYWMDDKLTQQPSVVMGRSEAGNDNHDILYEPSTKERDKKEKRKKWKDAKMKVEEVKE